MERVTIIGTGLIGGSLGLALKQQGFPGTITGVGRRETLARALKAGAIDRGQESLEAALRDAELVFLATPISVILDLLPKVRQHAPAGALVTDAGSTKAAIADRAARLFDAAEGPRFIGGHPMAGSEKRGVEHASAGLFRGATWVLTPTHRHDLEHPVAQEFRRRLEACGARLAFMDAELHDEIVAYTSHLPQLVATALASTVLDKTLGDDLLLAGGGLRDTTRLADSSYAVWRDICLTNTENISEALDAMLQHLESIRDSLRSRELQHQFEAGQRLREKLQQQVQSSKFKVQS